MFTFVELTNHKNNNKTKKQQQTKTKATFFLG